MTDLLARVAIASPCTADWNTMAGDERRRFCTSCRLHVHDLSAMTAAEARWLKVPAGEPALRVHRLVCAPDESPLHTETALYRADAFSYRLSLRR